MKTKYELIALLFIVLLWGCGSDHEESVSSISTDKTEITFDSNEDMQILKITSSGEWKVTGQTEWCTVSPDSGSNGQTVTISVKTNESNEDRSCILLFSCGEATLKVGILQYGRIETNYVDLNIGKGGTITSYNESTGELKVQYSQSTPPKVEAGKALVLSQEYNYAIRVVKSVQTSANSLTLQTEAGNMTNIFKNIDFTLATDPDMVVAPRTRSGKRVRVVTPREAYLVSKNGDSQKIYDNSSTLTKGKWTDNNSIFSMTRDFSKSPDNNVDIYKGTLGNLYWEKCTYGIELKGVFSFEFGETPWNNIVKGDLQRFEYYLQGDFNMDFLLKYEFTSGLEKFDDKEWQNVLPSVQFVFTIGNVPVMVKVSTHWGISYNFKADAEVVASAGFYLGTQTKTGLSWQKDVGVEEIKDLHPTFTVYDPTITFKGALYGKVSSYPKVEIDLYNFVGPWFALMPYVEEKLEAGFQNTASGKNQYMGWTSNMNGGIELDMGLSMDFGLFEKYEWNLPKAPYSLLKKTIFEAPHKIELVSPEKNATLTEGTEQEVTFRVTSYSDLTPDKTYNCPLAAVQFTSENGGKLEKEFVITDEEGLANVKWTPKGSNDKLTAKIVDKEGNVLTDEKGNEIGLAVFEPIIERIEIELYSHKDKDKMEQGSPETIQFKVNLIDKDGKKSPKYGAKVEFTPSELSSAITDEHGMASVNWAPTKEGDRLTAKVVNKVTDKDGHENTVTVTAATFTPTVTISSIALVAPTNGTIMNEGENINVSFLVQYLSGGQKHSYTDRDVYFSSKDFKQTITTGADGKATLKWIPKGTDDVLTAEIKDKTGKQTVQKATFTPVIKGKEITFVSASSKQIKKGESVTVTFAVKESSSGTARPQETVSFSASSGTLSASTGKTNDNGTISVIWTPTVTGDILTAQLDNNKKATYKAVIEGDEPTASIIGVWGTIKQPMMILHENNTITLFRYSEEGNSSETHPFTYNKSAKNITTTFNDGPLNIQISKLTLNILLSPFFNLNGQTIPLVRLTDDQTGYDVEDGTNNSKLLEGQWKDAEGVLFTFNDANKTFSMKDTDGENISGTYSYDPSTKTIKVRAGSETDSMPVVCLNKDLLIIRQQGEGPDASESFDWVLYKP